MSVVSIREFELLSCHAETPTHQISESAFSWLKQQVLQQQVGKARFLILLAKYGIECL